MATFTSVFNNVSPHTFKLAPLYLHVILTVTSPYWDCHRWNRYNRKQVQKQYRNSLMSFTADLNQDMSQYNKNTPLVRPKKIRVVHYDDQRPIFDVFCPSFQMLSTSLPFIPQCVFCVGMGVYAVLHLECSIERHASKLPPFLNARVFFVDFLDSFGLSTAPTLFSGTAAFGPSS